MCISIYTKVETWEFYLPCKSEMLTSTLNSYNLNGNENLKIILKLRINLKESFFYENNNIYNPEF